ncbi:MAG TPA: M48 family metallopeptidase [Chthonomonadales bacterium]|nr:M48 family metallopeptidase [Chthonomonadales bacterium]
MPATVEGRYRFPGIAPATFEHPLDRAALDALRRTPGLDTLFRKLSSLHFERQVRLYFTGDSLRLSPGQCPRLYNLMREAADVLDLEPPELYMMQAPFPNAVAIGMDRFTLVCTTGLVNVLNDDELRAVMGHEMGHMKSGHMLYRTIAIFLSTLGVLAARNLPVVQILSHALMYAFYDWFRKSELTADRAGLLVAQDPDVSVRVLLKLVAGTQVADQQLDPAEFLKQADDFEDMDSSILNVLYKFEMTRFQSHPFPALRAREIVRWAESDAYRGILSGAYERVSGAATSRVCGRCACRVENPMFRFCPECGAELPG